MKILTVVGARPQFIKAAMVSRALQKLDITEVMIHTGQHFDNNMSSVFFDELELPVPKYNLGIAGGSHGEMTGNMLRELDSIIISEQPDGVLVYGDTNSTLAAALAASKLHVPVFHVEAGLRSFNRKMPEEINRILTDHISSLHFCPSEESKCNLENEGVKGGGVIVVGDVMRDSIDFFKEKSKSIEANYDFGEEYCVATVHRAENVDDEQRFKTIFSTLEKISNSLPVVLPVHPRVRNRYQSLLEGTSIKLVDPLGYLEMIQLVSNSRLVLTDSGGLQKEAYFLKKPCITLRDETEWVELVSSGCNILTGADSSKIQIALDYFTDKKIDFNSDLYGASGVSILIGQHIQNFVQGRS